MDEFITVIAFVAMVVGLAYCGVKQGVPDEMQAFIDPGQRMVRQLTLRGIQDDMVSANELSTTLQVNFDSRRDRNSDYLSPGRMIEVNKFYIVGTTTALLKLCIHDVKGPRCVGLDQDTVHNPTLLAAVKALPEPVTAKAAVTPPTAAEVASTAKAPASSPIASTNESPFSSF